MKKSALLALSATLACSSAFAGTGGYVGFIAGSDMVSVNGVDDGTVIGLSGGYRFTDLFALEGTATTSDHDTVLPACSVTIDTLALYGAFRSPGQTYLKGKIGALSEDLSSSGSCAGASNSDSGGSVGIGVGTHITDGFVVELEYTMVEQDVDRLSLGAFLTF